MLVRTYKYFLTFVTGWQSVFSLLFGNQSHCWNELLQEWEPVLLLEHIVTTVGTGVIVGSQYI